MAPARRARRDQAPHPSQPQHPISPPDVDEHGADDELFVDPLMGTPLAIYVEKDVDNRDEIVELIMVRNEPTFWPPAQPPLDAFLSGVRVVVGTGGLCVIYAVARRVSERAAVSLGFIVPDVSGLQKYGGTVSPGYSGVAYILGELLYCGECLHIANEMARTPPVCPPSLTLFPLSGSAQGVGAEPLPAVCGQEGQNCAQCAVGHPVRGGRRPTNLSQQLWGLQSDGHGEVGSPFDTVSCFAISHFVGSDRIAPVVHPQSQPQQPEPGPSVQHVPQPTREEMVHPVHPDHVLQQQQVQQHQAQQQVQHHAHSQPPHAHGQVMPTPSAIAMAHPAPIVAHSSSFPYPVYAGPGPMDVAPRALQPPTSAPPQTWQAPNGIAPAQTTLAPPPPPPPPPPPVEPPHMLAERHQGYADEQQAAAAWSGEYHHPHHPHAHAMQQPPPGIVPAPPQDYEYRYRDDQGAPPWVPAQGYYDSQVCVWWMYACQSVFAHLSMQYEQPYTEPPPDQFMEEAGPSNTQPSVEPPLAESPGRVTRGRKRTKVPVELIDCRL